MGCQPGRAREDADRGESGLLQPPGELGRRVRAELGSWGRGRTEPSWGPSWGSGVWGRDWRRVDRVIDRVGGEAFPAPGVPAPRH